MGVAGTGSTRRFLLLMVATSAVLSASSSLLCIYAITKLQARVSSGQETSVWQRVPLLLRKWSAQRARQQATHGKTTTKTRSNQGVPATGKRRAASPSGGKQVGGKRAGGKQSGLQPRGAKPRVAAQRKLNKWTTGAVTSRLRSVMDLAAKHWTLSAVHQSPRGSSGRVPAGGANATGPAWHAVTVQGTGAHAVSRGGAAGVQTSSGVGGWRRRRTQVPPCKAKWRQALRRDLHRIVLIVNNNFPGIARSTTPFLRRVYGPFFDNIVFIAPEAVPSAGIQARSEHPFGKRWYGAYLALEWIVRAHPDAEGFLWTNDDVAINYWKLRGANKTRIWAQRYLGRSFPFSPGQKTEFEDDWPASPSTRNAAWMAYQAMDPSFRAQFGRSMMPVRHRYPKRVSDIFYLPRSDSLVLVDKLLPHFKRFSVWSEVAVPMMLFALRHPAQYDEVLDSMVYRWEHRANKSLIFDPRHYWDPDSVGLHPWKMSKLAAKVQFLQTLGAMDSCMLTVQKYYL